MSHLESIEEQPDQAAGKTPRPDDSMSDLTYAFGIILGLSYPILALSTGARAVYQLFLKEGMTYYLPSLLSAVAASCYLGATVGFFVRRRWAWRLSVGLLGIETMMTLTIGTLSFIYPDLIGRTVWRHFGMDYGFFPFFQPIIGLIWLFSPGTLRAYGISLRWTRQAEENSNL